MNIYKTLQNEEGFNNKHVNIVFYLLHILFNSQCNYMNLFYFDIINYRFLTTETTVLFRSYIFHHPYMTYVYCISSYSNIKYFPHGNCTMKISHVNTKPFTSILIRHAFHAFVNTYKAIRIGSRQGLTECYLVQSWAMETCRKKQTQKKLLLFPVVS